MQSIQFLKELRKKGTSYSDVWLGILMRLELKEKETVKIFAPYGMTKTTYHRIINFGVEKFTFFFNEISVFKSRTELIFEVATKAKSKEVKSFVLQKPIEEKKEVEPIAVVEVKKSEKPKEPKLSIDVYKEIIDYLNEMTGQSFRHQSKATQSFINARFTDGFTLEDFKKVIYVKSAKWKNTKMQDFLRPSTLFSNKFEGYLNESIITEPNNQQKNYDNAVKATELGWNTVS